MKSYIRNREVRRGREKKHVQKNTKKGKRRKETQETKKDVISAAEQLNTPGNNKLWSQH
jgi:hypothetical protein